MGAWGSGVLQDDTVADIVGFLKDRLQAGDSLDAAGEQALSQFAPTQRDADEAPLLWLALAAVQWQYGSVKPGVLDRVRADVASGQGLDRWREDDRALAARRRALGKFLAKVSQPNPRPSAPPKAVSRPAWFQTGDALAVRLPDGRYTAALIVDTDQSKPSCGRNLVASLDYLDAAPPDLAVFERRRWLWLPDGRWGSRQDIWWSLPGQERALMQRVQKVGQVTIRPSDQKEIAVHAGWVRLGKQILLQDTVADKAPKRPGVMQLVRNWLRR